MILGFIVFLVAVGIVFLALLLFADAFPIASDMTRRDVYIRLIVVAILLVFAIWIVAVIFSYSLSVYPYPPCLFRAGSFDQSS